MKKWRGDLAFVVLVAALIGAWFYLYPRQTEGPLAPLDPPPELDDELPSYAGYDGRKLRYGLFEPQGEVEDVMILLHDTLLHGGWYADLGRALAGEGVAVYLPDRRGRGQSEGEPAAMTGAQEVLIDDITALVAVAQARYPQTDIYLGGHGRGAGLAASYAATGRPLSGLILIAPYLSAEQGTLRGAGWNALLRAHPVQALLARAGLVHWRVWHVNWPRSMLDADPMLAHPFSVADLQETEVHDLGACCGGVTTPLLVVQGASDPLFLADAMPGLVLRFASEDRRLETVPDAGFLTVIPAAANPIAHWLEGR